MKMTDGLFLRAARRVHQREYPNIEYQELIIDAGCMKLVQDPTQFDVLLLENLYGDVVSDLCAGLVGGLGVVPGANFGERHAVFEAVHGSAPDIAGKGIANPLALLMSAVMMLNHLADERDDAAARQPAERIKTAYDRALEDGQKTRDLGGDARHRGVRRRRDRAPRLTASREVRPSPPHHHRERARAGGQGDEQPPLPVAVALSQAFQALALVGAGCVQGRWERCGVVQVGSLVSHAA